MPRRDDGWFSEAEINRLVRFYEQAEREILDQLNRALLRGNKTEYLAQMKKNIEAILEQVRAGNRTWSTEAIPRVYSQGLYSADAMLKDTGATVKAGFGDIHQQAAQVMAENAFQRFEDVAQVIGRQVNDIYRELALENVRGTVVGYDTWKQTARRYREQLADRGVTGFKDRSGRMWNMRTYTEMVARTTTMEAHLQGTANRLAEQGYDLVKVSSHQGACKLCQPWQGMVLSITGKTPGYTTLEEARAAGLFHVNCRHAYGLYVDLDKESKAPEGVLGLSPEEAKNYLEIDGLSVPAKAGLAKALTETLEHGLKTGKECLLHIDATTGKSIYSKVEGTANSVVFPQALVDFLDKAASNSVISIHNHPSSSSYSAADLSVTSRYKSISHLFVVGHDRTRYVLSVGQGLRPVGTEISKAWKTAHDKHFDYFSAKGMTGELAAADAWKEHTHLIAKEVVEKFGWEYRRVMPGER
jgi:hypothetical protein